MGLRTEIVIAWPMVGHPSVAAFFFHRVTMQVVTVDLGDPFRRHHLGAPSADGEGGALILPSLFHLPLKLDAVLKQFSYKCSIVGPLLRGYGEERRSSQWGRGLQ